MLEESGLAAAEGLECVEQGRAERRDDRLRMLEDQGDEEGGSIGGVGQHGPECAVTP